MRTDYKYIEDATSLVMTTTEKGHKYLEKLYENNNSQIDEAEGLEELLLILEDEYIVIPNESDIDVWIEAINDVYDEQFRASTNPLQKEHILEGIKLGYIGFKVVIWDDKKIYDEETIIDDNNNITNDNFKSTVTTNFETTYRAV